MLSRKYVPWIAVAAVIATATGLFIYSQATTSLDLYADRDVDLALRQTEASQ